MRIAIALIAISFVLLFAGCSKNNLGSEEVFYGTWVKGQDFGDTLVFMKKNGKNVMRQAMSFNAGLAVYAEKEYKYVNGKLSIKTFSPSSQDYYPITSFAWTQPGKEFTIEGIQLYIFMSSTMTYFTFKKI